MVIGLTGSIAVGKSTVFEIIKEKLKDKVNYLDTDRLTSKLYENKKVKDNLLKMFNTCEKKEISKIVFSDKEKLKKLNEYIHKIIIEQMKETIKNNDKEYLIIDTPLLFELNLEYLFDKIVVVYATKEEQVKRLMKRNNFNEKEAKLRIETQIDIEEKKKKADIVIENMGDIEKLKNNIEEVLKCIK